jgi:hypothetical protein
MGEGDWSIQCVQCGQYFEAKRSDASFCSTNCRVAYSREADKIINHISWLNQVAAQVLEKSRKYKKVKDVYEATVKLQKDINAAAGMFEE